MNHNDDTEGNVIPFPDGTPNEEMQENSGHRRKKSAKKNKNYGRTILFSVLAAVFILIVFGIFGDSGFKSTDAVNTEPISVLSTANYSFADYKTGFVFAHDGKVSCYNTNLELQWETDGSKTAPTVKTNGKYALTYYIDDKVAVLSDGSSNKKIKTDGKVISASLNDNGYSTIIVKEDGFKNQVAVYDTDGNAVFKWHNSDRYIISSYLSNDNRMLVSGEVVMKDNRVTSNVLVIDTRKDLKINEISFDESAICDIHFVSKNRFIVVCDDKTACYNTKLSEKWLIDYSKKNLYTYDISDNDTLALVFGKDDSLLSSSDIEYYNTKGRKIGNFKSESRIDGIDMQGNYSLITYNRRLAVVNSKGKELSSKELNYDIRKCIFMGNRRCALVISGASASLVKP